MKRTKLIAMVSTLCLSLVMLLVGIWAAVIVNFNMYGSLTFAPEGIYVEISGQVFRGNSVETLEPITNDPRFTLEPQTNFDYSTGEPSGNFPIPSWEINNLVFAPMLKFIQIEVYVTNYSDFSITSTPNVTIDNQEISAVTGFNITNNTTELEEIAPTTTATYKLTIEVTSPTEVPKDLSVSFVFNEWLPPDASEFPTLTFTPNGDGTASVGRNNSNLPTGELIIPAKVLINGESHSVTSISYNAFQYCSALSSVTIPDSVTSIGDFAFRDCSAIQSITISNSVTSIGKAAFRDCSLLTSITIPDSVTSIGGEAFSNCSALESITIPDSVTSIGAFAFNGCDALQYKTLNNGKYLGNKNNPHLVLCDTKTTDFTEFTINEDCKIIYYGAFKDCNSFTNITIPQGVTYIGSFTFVDCSALKSITIPEGVTSIFNYTFDGCSALKSITIPEGVTSIDSGAFRDCSSLTSITIPEGVTSIDSYTFDGCSSLTSITIPERVTSIGNYAFRNCSKLTNVTIKSNYAYRTATSTSACGNLLKYAITVRVLTSCIGESINTYLNNTSNFTKTTTTTIDGDYTVYTKK